MEEARQSKKDHVLVVPFPAQGHINPMLQLCKLLSTKGIKPTLSLTVCISKSINTTTIPTHHGPPIQLRPISDGYDEGGLHQAESIEAYLDSIRTDGPKTLTQIIKKLSEEGDPVTAIIYDGFMPWVFNVAQQFGLARVLFFTESCTVNSIYYHVQRGLIQLPLMGPGPSTVSVPGAPELQPWETPSFLHKFGSFPVWFEGVLRQYNDIDHWRVGTIGPTIPSYYLDKSLEDEKDHNFQLFKPNTTSCKNWLDTKPRNSVIYVSFGSLIKLTEEQFEEVAWSLKNGRYSFLWVVRELEQAKLPKGFIDEIFGQGLVVGWASQLEVLAHEATGCFVTHCGLNSILEAFCLGVPIVGVPRWTDQATNAKFVEDVWGVGVRTKVDKKGIVRRENLDECIRKIMEGDIREEIMKNVAKWKKLAKQTLSEGGSSYKNIDEFVAYLA
ncbi:UDP-glycosyltransferase 74G1 [Bienertia sinuspersici]